VVAEVCSMLCEFNSITTASVTISVSNKTLGHRPTAQWSIKIKTMERQAQGQTCSSGWVYGTAELRGNL